MLKGLSQAGALIPEFLPESLTPFLSIGGGGWDPDLGYLTPNQGLMGSNSRSKVSRSGFSHSLSSTFLPPFSSLFQETGTLPSGRVWGDIREKARRLLGPWDFLLLSVLGLPLDTLITPASASVSDSASTSGGHRPFGGRGAFLFGSRQPVTTLGRKELKPGPRINEGSSRGPHWSGMGRPAKGERFGTEARGEWGGGVPIQTSPPAALGIHR